MSFDAQEDDLYTFFSPCGDLINVKLLRGKAFVKFSTDTGLNNALALNGTECCGRRLKIVDASVKYMPKPPVVRDVESTTVFVGGISYFTNEERLAEVFKDCGEIKDIRMPLNDMQDQVNCFVFVSNIQ